MWPFSETTQHLRWTASPEFRQYLLPRQTCCIRLEPFWKAQKRLAGLFWLKKLADFQPAVQETALREAQEHLTELSVRQSRRKHPLPRGLVVVAFGTKAQCFEWEIEGGDQERSSEGERENLKKNPAARPLGDGAVFDIYIDDQREGFEKIFRRFRDEVEAKWAAGPDDEEIAIKRGQIAVDSRLAAGGEEAGYVEPELD